MRALVELHMLAAVHHFLGGERLDLGGERGARALAEQPHALDEKSLALGKGCRQRIVERRRHRIAAIPPAVRGLDPPEAPVARRDRPLKGCRFVPPAVYPSISEERPLGKTWFS